MDDYKPVALAFLAVGIAAYAVRWYTDPVSPPRACHTSSCLTLPAAPRDPHCRRFISPGLVLARRLPHAGRLQGRAGGGVQEGTSVSSSPSWTPVVSLTSLFTVVCDSLQYPDSAFKIPTLDRWMVIFSGRDMVEELRKRGDEELSGPGGSEEVRSSLVRVGAYRNRR